MSSTKVVCKQLSLLRALNSWESLPVGFGFRPTEVELVTYYLRGKIERSLRLVDEYMIPEVDVYKCDPSDLCEKSLFQSRDQVWHFFSPKDRNYRSWRCQNRATPSGQWVLIWKEREITASPESPVLGKRRTFVFRERRASSGIRTIWTINEYSTTEEQDAFVLCRLLKKLVEVPPEQIYWHNNMASSGSNRVTDVAAPQQVIQSSTTPSTQTINSIRLNSTINPTQQAIQPLITQPRALKQASPSSRLSMTSNIGEANDEQSSLSRPS